jgi:hypothetical protein
MLVWAPRIERVRVCWPVPHDLVQSSQEENGVVAQCCGQGSSLHDKVSSVSLHVSPPHDGSVMMLRDLYLLPPPVPQLFVQVILLHGS